MSVSRRASNGLFVAAVVTCLVSRGQALLLGQQPIQPVPFMPFADGNDSMVMSDLTYRIGDTALTIIVPAGFVTDFASVPRVFWSVLPPTGTYSLAAVVHDYLYWDQGCTREQADQLLRAAMVESRVGTVQRDLIYEAVRSGGGTAWSSNAVAKAAGQPRIIPPAFRTIPALMTWATYRPQLVAAGVRPAPTPSTAPSYCTAASAVPAL